MQILTCVLCRDSVVMKTEADSNDITEYTPDYKPTVGMFEFSYDAVMCLFNIPHTKLFIANH